MSTNVSVEGNYIWNKSRNVCGSLDINSLMLYLVCMCGLRT